MNSREQKDYKKPSLRFRYSRLYKCLIEKFLYFCDLSHKIYEHLITRYKMSKLFRRYIFFTRFCLLKLVDDLL
nr:MAG TPA: hypothetical protein [Caudoviricetes sp.]